MHFVLLESIQLKEFALCAAVERNLSGALSFGTERSDGFSRFRGTARLWEAFWTGCPENYFRAPQVCRICSSGCRGWSVSAEVRLCDSQSGDVALKDTTDVGPITKLLFSPASMSIFTACGRELKVWSALTGTLVKIHRDVSDADISALCFDDRERKLVVGDVAGRMKVLNHADGAIMKGLRSHKLEVSGLCYSKLHKAIITTSWDATM